MCGKGRSSWDCGNPDDIGPVPRLAVVGCRGGRSGRLRTSANLEIRAGWTPANGFEDPCGRVEFRTGPKGPLTQRSINRLGVR